MGKVVMGVGVPHTPFFPDIAEKQGDSSRMVMMFNRVRQEFERVSP